MFLLTQLIGIAVIRLYSPTITSVIVDNQTVNVTFYNLPYGLEPPQNTEPKSNLISIIIALFISITLLILLMKIRAEVFLRLWFFIVVIIAISVTLYAPIKQVQYASLIALIIAIPLAALKVFKRNIITHNITELLIYPGIATIFIPLLNIFYTVILLIFISIYDIYAVWHSGIMQKMAKYQINKVKVFSGFFVPYLGKKEKELIKSSKSKNIGKKVKVNVAILGGGDVVFPLILAGVVLNTFNLFSAILIAIGATISLGLLFYMSKKGKFYPAMPFISSGCLIALGIVYLIN